MLPVTAGSEHLTRAMRALEATFLIGVEGVTEVWLVRHADCYEDMTEADDPPLSALGRRQAGLLAERVRAANPAAVYSSPYRRALETARAITNDVRVDNRLIEMAVDVSEEGQLEFKEALGGVSARMQDLVGDIAREHAGERVVAVGHGAAIIAYLTDVLDLEPGRLRLIPYYTSVSVVRVLGDVRMVGGLVDVAHLE
jgi:2,3-bisphosphoglycerate-dependent phosphoglycerate mutase